MKTTLSAETKLCVLIGTVALCCITAEGVEYNSGRRRGGNTLRDRRLYAPEATVVEPKPAGWNPALCQIKL